MYYKPTPYANKDAASIKYKQSLYDGKQKSILFINLFIKTLKKIKLAKRTFASYLCIQ